MRLAMQIDDVLITYKDVRSQAARTPTFWLRRRERQARRATQGGVDQFALARLAALRDELGERGMAPPPIRRGLP